jgi:NADPH2:quinone reductase
MRKAAGPHSVRTLELRALAMAAAGCPAPAVQCFSLAEAATARRALETRATVLTVVIKP